MSAALIIGVSIAYILLLIAIAYWTHRSGKKVVNNPYVYALSIAVYCTAWTFFGSVGKAADSGIDFLPIYIGPTIAAVLWWLVLRKMILISKNQRITSIADFISSRYGKSSTLGAIVTIIAIIVVIPYISIQLKAIAVGYDLLTYTDVEIWNIEKLRAVPFYLDATLYITIALAVLAIFFGTRNLDPNERHEGLVAIVAFESIIKLVTFLAVGLFVVFGVFNGFDDIFTQSMTLPETRRILSLEQSKLSGWSWFWLVLLSMLAIILLPRQFHIAVVENTDAKFVQTAAWAFPLYLLLINIFVLPIALAGLLKFGTSVNADMFVLALPMNEGYNGLALLVAIGGFSASMGMVVVAVTALGIMISNNIVHPLLLRSDMQRPTLEISGRLIGIRRVSMVMVLILSYGYFKLVSIQYPLVSIGLISFAGVAQFAPSVIGGIFWKRATRQGAIAGLLIGFAIWAFCLPLPTLSLVGVLPERFVEEGLFGISLLRPYQLFGMSGEDYIANAAFWSLLLNVAAYYVVSINTKQSLLGATQADIFVDIYKYQNTQGEFDVIKRRAKVTDIQDLLERFLGKIRAKRILANFSKRHKIDLSKTEVADERLVSLAETYLSGALGAASAKILLNSIVKTDPISLEEIFRLLEQTKEIMQYSKQLEQKSNELQLTTEELQSANERLKELDLLKADFITTVTHELRTPITSIKALSNILLDNPDLPKAQQQEYLAIVVSESDRIARLVNQVLDLEKIVDLQLDDNIAPLNFGQLVLDTKQTLDGLIQQENIQCKLDIAAQPMIVKGVKDRLMQAVLNLLSNAVKFCATKEGEIQIRVYPKRKMAVLEVQDNGIGISEKDQKLIFERFAQVTNHQLGKPKGTGLGLSITKEIIRQHQGDIWVRSQLGEGATFVIQLPLSSE